LEVIYNWCDEGSIQVAEKSEQRTKESESKSGFSVLFAGNMGKAQALDAVLKAAAIVAEKAPDVRFDFLGGGVEVDRLKSMAKEAGWRT
jgi:glycosyltransferase involved in cell wall biosynthesis